jgi:alpha-1,3-fucosyltransferase
MFIYFRFYLAFENSACTDYITEKFARLKHWLVPIVLNDEMYKDTVPKNSYIAVDKFPNIKALTNYLQYLQQNVTAYREYFRWRQTHTIIDPYTEDFHFGHSNAYCNLCAKVRQTIGTVSIARDIVNWYDGPGVCQDTS